MTHQVSNKYQETKLVVITREDISPGYVVVQSTHSIADFADQFPDQFKKWKSESNSIICLGAKSQKDLLKIYDKLSSRTQGCIFFEPDVDEYTSVCLYGTPEIRKHLSNLPLSLRNLGPGDEVTLKNVRVWKQIRKERIQKFIKKIQKFFNIKTV